MSNKCCPNDERLFLFATADLEPDELRTIDDHLAACQQCQQAVSSYHETLGALPQINLELTTEEENAFVNRVTENLPTPHRFLNMQTLGAAATTLAAGLIAVYVFNPGNMTVQPKSSPDIQVSEIDLVENFEMLDNLELLEELELLELLDDRG